MVTLVKTNDVYNVVVNYYEADSSADLANIDVSALNMGCKVHVIDEDKYYLLNGNNEWSEVTEGGGGGGTTLPSSEGVSF